MLISTRAILRAPSEPQEVRHGPGRENFSLMEPATDVNYNTLLSSGIGSASKTMKTMGASSTTTGGSTSGGGGGKRAVSSHYNANTAGKVEGSLVGWLQVRDIRNRKNYLQVVDPAPRGPFRKAPWHNGTFHVLKL